eukprot:scaffold10038_cov267-Chaetoceros_neogracile.AAC.17
MKSYVLGSILICAFVAFLQVLEHNKFIDLRKFAGDDTFELELEKQIPSLDQHDAIRNENEQANGVALMIQDSSNNPPPTGDGQPTRHSVIKTIDQSTNQMEQQDDQRACRVIIESKYDYHHEVIESAVLRYPLPWNEFNCSKTKPIIYEFSLFQNRWPDMWRYTWMPGLPLPNHLNETEFWGWKLYFERKLQGKAFERTDGRMAYYNRLISYNEMGNPSSFDAFIDLTCADSVPPFKFVTKGGGKTYCILHSQDERDITSSKWKVCLAKSCYLSPTLHPDSQCTFFPRDLPKIDNDDIVRNPSEVKLCIFGAKRNFSNIAAVFTQVLETFQEKEFDIKLYFAIRYPLESRMGRVFKAEIKNSAAALFNNTVVVHKNDYFEFAKFQASCDILLPEVTPSTRPNYFPPSVTGKLSRKQLTGAIPPIVAYKIPSIMHVELEKVYHPFFTAPVMTYNDTAESKLHAWTEMIMRVAKNKTMINTGA